jgi:hypothetical protein
MKELQPHHTTVFANSNGGPPPLPPPSRWKRARRAATELTGEAIEQIAQRVAELLRDPIEDGKGGRGAELLSAAAVARRLGVSRDWVYEHANELGALSLGDGSKPRLRFDPETVNRVLHERGQATPPAPPAGVRAPRARRRRRPSGETPLLPVYEPGKRGLLARWAVSRRRR